MMIDTHCHLDIEDYDNVEEVINRMSDNYIIASGCNLKTNRRVIELVNKYNNIYGTIGLHPTELEDDNLDEALKYIEDNVKNPKIVGIGEIGLDYHYDDVDKDKQKDYFIKQIDIAKKNNKTIVIHSRDSAEDTYNILKVHLGDNKAVLHCYGYSKEMAKKFMQMNIKFGIGGVLTFKNSSKLKETVEFLDLSYLLLETDSPYLSPEPFRGKTNEPYNIVYVAAKIAEIKNISIQKVYEITTENAIKQFDLNI